MKKSLTINATRDGKKVAKSFGFVNPNVANSLVGGFAQMVNNLTTDTFVNAQVVKVMDTTEEEQAAAPAKQEGIITYDEDSGIVTYNGDGTLYYQADRGDVETLHSGSQIARLPLIQSFFATATDNYTAAVLVLILPAGPDPDGPVPD